MTRLTSIILNEYNIKIPVVNIPIIRFKPEEGKPRFEGSDKDKFDNTILLSDVKKEVKKINHPINNILFVDDEIGESISAKKSLDLIMK